MLWSPINYTIQMFGLKKYTYTMCLLFSFYLILISILFNSGISGVKWYFDPHGKLAQVNFQPRNIDHDPSPWKIGVLSTEEKWPLARYPKNLKCHGILTPLSWKSDSSIYSSLNHHGIFISVPPFFNHGKVPPIDIGKVPLYSEPSTTEKIFSLFTFWGRLGLAIWCEVPHCVENRTVTPRCFVLGRSNIYPIFFLFYM